MTRDDSKNGAEGGIFFRRCEEVLQGMGNGLLILDHEWRCVFVNDNALPMLARSREELQGRTLRETHPDIVGTDFETRARNVMERRAPASFEMRFPSLNAWFDVHAYPLETGMAIQFTDVTERKNAEEALRRSEERFRAVLENSLDAAYRRDLRADTYDYLSPLIEKITGYTMGEFESLSMKPVLDMIHPDDVSRVLAALEQFMTSDKNEGIVEYRLRRKDGRYRWIADSLKVIRDEHGVPRYRIGSIRDITAQKEAELKLRENEATLEAIMEYIPEGLLVADAAAQRVTVASRYLADFMGTTRERMVGMPLDEYAARLHIAREERGDIATAEMPLARSLKTGEAALNEEYLLRRADGERVRVLINAVPIRAAGGVVTGAIASWRDISAIRKEQEARRIYEEQLNAFFSSSPVLMFTLDDDLRFVRVNRQTAESFGRAPDALTGMRIGDVSPTDISQVEQSLARVARSGVPELNREVQAELPERRGEPYWLASFFPVIMPGRRHGVGVIAINITERQKAEEALRESEALLDTFFSNTAAAMIIYGDDNRYVRANRYVAQLYGIPAEEMVGKTVADVLPADLARAIERHNREVIETKRPQSAGVYSASLPLRSRQGKVTYWQGVRFPVSLGGGKTGVGLVSIDITERVAAEEALRRREEELRAVTDNSPDVIARFDRGLRHTFINPYGEKVYGKPRSEIIGKTNEDLGMPADKVAYWKRHFEEVFATGRQQSVEFDFDSPVFGRQYFLSAFVPEFDGKGAVRSVLAISRDITQVKEAERRLSEAAAEARRRADEAEEGQRTLTALMDNIPEGIFIAEAPGARIRLVSRYMSEITGISREELQGLSDEEAGRKIRMRESSPAPAAKTLPLVRAVAHGEVVTDDEWLVSPPGKNPVTVLVNARPIRDGRGVITGGVSSWRDITERKKAEDALRRNEYELRTLVDNSPDLIFRLNRQLQYVYANPAYERMTGTPREEFIGKTNADVGMAPRMAEFWESAVEGVIERGREHSVEFDMTGLFGARFFLARLIPEFARSGLVETVLVIARDITERKRAEEQIRFISFHDEVTGLFNRAYFEEDLRRLDTERDLPLSIIMGDVNNLKLSNDVFGHEEGDKLLKAIAEAFRRGCRKDDIIARWGGDEFAVILPRTDFATADRVRGRVTQAAAESKGTIIRPSVALGAATKDAKDRNIYQTVRQAEEAMYRNKFDDTLQNEEYVFESLRARERERKKDADAHLGRCCVLADEFGRALSLSESQMDDLRLLVQLHDIGLAVLPRGLLAKPGSLTPQERETVQRHAEAGFRIVKNFADTARISDEVLSHGERWDGSGYPRGLQGKDIPYLARVFLVIDAFDAMTHPRPYARTLSREEAFGELRRNAGSQFDPELADAFVRALSGEKAVAR